MAEKKKAQFVLQRTPKTKNGNVMYVVSDANRGNIEVALFKNDDGSVSVGSFLDITDRGNIQRDVNEAIRNGELEI